MCTLFVDAFGRTIALATVFSTREDAQQLVQLLVAEEEHAHDCGECSSCHNYRVEESTIPHDSAPIYHLDSEDVQEVVRDIVAALW